MLNLTPEPQKLTNKYKLDFYSINISLQKYMRLYLSCFVVNDGSLNYHHAMTGKDSQIYAAR